ncbi:hypothetical protein JCM19275_1010 [Nonlabens ulvanivorans]|uniref:Uncharacterized protein n=2 Tax=Nonlabens ulvanivorans TaxID=906888 RepID=A0A090WDD9_NONUL|nr:hypothetical protein [Nonlabens ulvanivorans]GAL74971.1 hypothetical protein JCM19275_1010 [Nonlabens ulvanivorans]
MVKTLKSHEIKILPSNILEHLAQFDFRFNPSFINCDKFNYLAIRVCRSKGDEVNALLYKWSSEENLEILDLSNYGESNLEVQKVADPKLFKIDKSVYCTFNTGFVSRSSNRLFLALISDFNNIKIKECFFNDRQRIEKNWSFFKKNNELYAIYSINPLIILKAINKKENNDLIFEKSSQKDTTLPKLSLGTQLAKVGEDEYLMIAHKKMYLKNKRLYYGVPLIFNTKDLKVTTSCSSYLIDSYKSLFGNRFKFNKNLISCTYFSGICVLNDYFIISYGVNDIEMRIVKVKKEKLL